MEYKDLSTNPVNVVLQLVGAKWKLLIIKELLKKEMRFVELKKNLGCTAKVLTACLKEMEEDGLIVREEYDVLPPKVEYYLTDIIKWANEQNLKVDAYTLKNNEEIFINVFYVKCLANNWLGR